MVMSQGEGHSSAVALWLCQGDQRYPLAQIGDGRLYFDKPMMLREREAQLERVIDGVVRRWDIVLDLVNTPQRPMRFEFCGG